MSIYFQSDQALLQFKSPVALGRLSPVTHARITMSQKEAADGLKGNLVGRIIVYLMIL